MKRTPRQGLTLLEVIAALSLMAALATISAAGFRIAAVSTVETATTAQSLRLELAKTRRLAIKSGESHGIRFVSEGGRIAGFVPYRRRSDGVEVRATQPIRFSDGTAVSVSEKAVEFASEGNAVQACQIKLAAEARTWQISVVPVTGTVVLREL